KGDRWGRGVAVTSINANLHTGGREDLNCGLLSGLRKCVSVATDVESSVVTELLAIFDDRGSNRRDMAFVEGAVERRTTVPGRSEHDWLDRLAVIVGRNKLIDIDEVLWKGWGTCAFIHDSILPLKPHFWAGSRGGAPDTNMLSRTC